MDKKQCNTSQDPEVRKGPWTMEEDLILINYISNHGEGVWNSLAKAAGKHKHIFVLQLLLYFEYYIFYNFFLVFFFVLT